MHQIYKINEMNRTEAELVEKTLDQIRKEKGAAYGESFKVRFIDIEMRSHLGRPHVRMCIDDLTASGKIDFISSKGRGGCTCSMIGPPHPKQWVSREEYGYPIIGKRKEMRDRNGNS